MVQTNEILLPGDFSQKFNHFEWQYTVTVPDHRSNKIALLKMKADVTRSPKHGHQWTPKGTKLLQQESIPVGCVPSAAVAVCWGVCSRGCLPRGESARGVSAQGARLPWGCLPGGVSQHALRQTPLWTEWLTDRCKNITFPQLRLRTVKSRTFWSCKGFQSLGEPTSFLPAANGFPHMPVVKHFNLYIKYFLITMWSSLRGH